MFLQKGKKIELQHPKALYILFFTELWERFSFYAIRSLLVLYMTRELLFGDSKSYAILGAYGALIYASNLIGGYLSDHFLGNRRAVMIGGMIIACGHLTLALPTSDSLFYGLSLLVVGTGLFKPNISSFLGQFYDKDDSKRDSGFTYFYMGINIGGVLGTLLCGYIGETLGWHYGFGVAAFGMLIGLRVFYKGSKHFANKGLPSDLKMLDEPVLFKLSMNHIIILGSLLAAPIFAYLLKDSRSLGGILNITGLLGMISLLIVAFKSNDEEKKCILTLLFMFVFWICYWSIWEQIAGTISLFTARNVDRNIMGFMLPASWSQALNPMFILILGPIVSKTWIYLGSKGKSPIAPIKFVMGFVATGLGFLIFTLGIKYADVNGMVSMAWLIAGFLLFSLGELVISPSGLSMTTKLSPARLSGVMMGCLFFSMGLANYIAQRIAILFSTKPGTDLTTDKYASLIAFDSTFLFIFKFAMVTGLLLLICVPFIGKVFRNHK